MQISEISRYMFGCSKYFMITTFTYTSHLPEVYAKLNSDNNFFFGNDARNSNKYISLHFQACCACVLWFSTRNILFSSCYGQFLRRFDEVPLPSLLSHPTFTPEWKESISITVYLNWQHKLFLASRRSILLRLNRLTAPTISHVSVLILPKSQLHLDYNSADINTLELFSTSTFYPVAKLICM